VKRQGESKLLHFGNFELFQLSIAASTLKRFSYTDDNKSTRLNESGADEFHERFRLGEQSFRLR